MSAISDAIRPFWLPRIQTVTGRPIKGLHGFLLDRQYQIYTAPTAGRVELSCADLNPLLKAFAFDITRFASAAIESIADVRPDSVFPKSTAWLMIRTYYAAFFSAHALSRMLGVSYTRFEGNHTASIYKVADLFLSSPAMVIPRLNSGQYRCEVDYANNIVRCELLTSNASGGYHEVFWTSFVKLLKQLSNNLLSATTGTPEANLRASEALDALTNILETSGEPGSWLSKVRNAINYQQALGCWFPYSDPKEKVGHTFARAEKWQLDLDKFNLSGNGDELEQFHSASLYLIALCREIALDMSERAPRGKSFHSVGILALLRMSEAA